VDKPPFSAYNAVLVGFLWVGFAMQRLPFAVLTAALLLAASGAYAFEIQNSANTSAGARFSDPDEQTDAMAAHLSGDNSSHSMSLFGGSMSIQGGSSDSGFSPAMQDRFMGGPDAIGRAYSAPR
jgi:hypothetical protein